MSKNSKAYHIQVRGLVQGVGFRPFIYRIALSNNLTGWVENRNDGVLIHVEGNELDIKKFLSDFKQKAPPVSKIQSIKKTAAEFTGLPGFEIVKSSDVSGEITEISPDIAVCSDCLQDMKQQPHRINYPFINCTNCGPRFTIIKDLPYDRHKTTMSEFRMCKECEREYNDILDRRFHAQPVACKECGPWYRLMVNGKSYTDITTIVQQISSMIENGKIIAIKGLGGFFIACDALNEKSVERLRKVKDRDGKPFAVMFGSLETLKEFASLNAEEEKEITSWRRPIVLLESKKPLAKDVSVGFHTVGAMLPYMPFHHMLFDHLTIPAIVLTSGNISEQPILIDNDTAAEKLSGRIDALLDYNREIYNRTDDSVVMVVNDTVRPVRRSRGFVPAPIHLAMDVDGILATGAELVNCFCLGKGDQAIMSQHIGDLKNLETYEFFRETILQFQKLFRLAPDMVVCDMHPDYLSTRYAEESGLEVSRVQHHHAHIASCMAEYNLDEKVIGVSMDGIGYGDDGNIWGGEFLVCDLADYARPFHFEYVPMPGGDKATEEPWRMAVAYLYTCFGDEFLNLDLPFLKQIDDSAIRLVIQAIDKKINTPLTSSAGRLFDTIAAMTNICTRSDFHAEAPMRLESAIDPYITGQYDFIFSEEISFRETIRGIVKDIRKNLPVSHIAAKFHNTIISAIFAAVSELTDKTGIHKIALSGGTFQNRYILERVEKKLSGTGLTVYSPREVPVNDGGIALGQLVVAAKRRSKSCV